MNWEDFGDEAAEAFDNALTGGSQHITRGIDPPSALLTAVEQKVVKGSPGNDVVVLSTHPINHSLLLSRKLWLITLWPNLR